MEQKITFKKHFKHIWPLIIFSFIMLFVMLIVWVNSSAQESKPIYFAYLILAIEGIINIYLHLEYYSTNRNVVVLYDTEKKEIRYKKGHQQDIIVLPETINCIELHQSRFLKNKGGLLTTDKYHFYKFFLEDGRTIVITSLLYPDFQYDLGKMVVLKERTVASVLINVSN